LRRKKSIDPAELATATLHWNRSIGVGPDGFRYAVAFRDARPTIPNAVAATTREIACVALREWAGVVIFAKSPLETTPLWSFGLGDVAMLADGRLGPFDAKTVEPPPSIDRTNVGTPDESVLPPSLREAMATFLASIDGVGVPKVALVITESSGRYNQPWALVPNVPPTAFATERDWIATLERFAWFVPRHFLTIRPPADAETFARWFRDVVPVTSTAKP
jgi:hypothetical protein